MKKLKPSLKPLALKSPTGSLPKLDRDAARLPFPRVGDVLNYVYLWASERRAGRVDGAKERPVLVVVADAPSRRVVVVPVTTHPQREGRNHISLPQSVATRAMGLPRSAESWIVVDEANSFEWVGYDLRLVPAKKTHLFGHAPDRLTLEVIDALIASRASPVTRD